MIVADMPFMSYQASVYDAVCNAGRLMKEGRAQAVKLEGGKEVFPQIEAITKASIPVVAHLGLTPQSLNVFGGFKVQGKSEEAAKKINRGCQRSRSGRSGSRCFRVCSGKISRIDLKTDQHTNDRHWRRCRM